MTWINWKSMDTYDPDVSLIPNRLVFLRVTKVQEHGLRDVPEEAEYTTMGNWFPDTVDAGSLTLPGKWVCVGWNWDNDEFCDCTEFEPVAWAEIPE